MEAGFVVLLRQEVVDVNDLMISLLIKRKEGHEELVLGFLFFNTLCKEKTSICLPVIS